ncbi:amino acid adenylation domain-containing protein [Streptomyces demainii]|uniref:Amino acid adenylation domain-containing protein n=1 Tax=Streptomyces demainii TaxID=588122 RepID=A0ABT9L6X7_9ACTN|nr:amino acid adenylation domain-containing protein [Streptomyces demainii]MDP9616466.1 amino acid adenylation domain-containing protein [Streptomyces demainii]
MATAPPQPRARAERCHSLTVRCPRSLTTRELHRRRGAGAAAWPLLNGLTLWEVHAPVDSSDAAAESRTHKEAGRPLAASDAPLRAVLVRYTDGVVDLVLVAERSTVPRPLLDQLAAVLVEGPAQVPAGPLAPAAPATGTALPEAAAPSWGLGDPARAAAVGTVCVELSVPDAGVDERLLAAATAVALTRYDDEDIAMVGVLDAQGTAVGRPLAYVLTVDDDLSVANCLERFATGPQLLGATDAGEPPVPRPLVGLVFGPARQGHRYRPCLFPVFPLTFSWERGTNGSFTGVCWYDEGAVDPRIAEGFARHVVHLATRMARCPGTMPLRHIETMTEAEAHDILRLGAVAVPAPDTASTPTAIHQRFAEVARLRPDAVAVTDDRSTLTYRELDERAERLAHRLRALGVPSGTTVGVCLERNATLVVTLLGVLKAGCAYVPMDTRYPEERLRYTATDARVPLVIGDPDTLQKLDGVPVVGTGELLRPAPEAPGQEPGDGRAATATSGDTPAYVIYTSGSTGRPKGVVVPHRNVLALVRATEDDFRLGPDDVWSFFHSSAFDFSVWEIWGCLLTGGRLVVVPYWVTRATDEFHELLAERKVTVLSQTPSAFSQLVEVDRTSSAALAVRLVVFGGEPLDSTALLPWFTRHPHTECRLVNMFGITETTVHVTARTVTPAFAVARSRSVGRALPGWSVSVRDTLGRIVPLGVAGEIWVGGAGVAHGYLGRPELTDERFVTDEASGGRTYRSGDKGRMRPDGSLDHLGRIDNQVKLRGHRIELDEIRNVLLDDPLVSGAVVVLRHAEPGDRAGARIDAYAVIKPGGTPHEVMANAARVLPEYMLPSTLAPVESIPLTLNGKPDVGKLPPPCPLAPAPGGGGGADVPRGTGDDPLADTVLAIWSRHLKAEVRLEDNFFQLGGNSLLVVRMLAELRSEGLPKVSMQDFYRNSGAGQFIELVRRLRWAVAPAADATAQ